MHITVPVLPLRAALANVHRVVERRNTIPILSNVLLAAADGELRITGTDLDIAATAVIDAGEPAGQDALDGAITAPAGMLFDIARKLPDSGTVTLQAQENALLVSCGRTRLRLQALPATDFPDLHMDGGAWSAKPLASDVTVMMEAVLPFVSTDESRYMLNGICFTAPRDDMQDHGDSECVATDGHRMARFTWTMHRTAAEPGNNPSILLPRKACDVLKAMAAAAGKGAAMEIIASETKFQASAEIGGGVALSFRSKLIDGTLPDYTRVIPFGNDRIWTADAAALAAMADRVSIVASEKGRAVKLAFAGAQLTASIANPDAGSASEEMDVAPASDAARGGGVEVGFNSRYLAEIVTAATGGKGEISIALADPGAPTLLTTPDRPGQQHVLMPMRV